MITKVLIAEDHESANLSIQKTLEALHVAVVDYVYYCDDALEKIKKAKQEGKSYDLLITDLYFEKDHQVQKIPGGVELVAASRQEQPDLKIIVFSAENKPAAIELLFKNQDVDGYVRKARNDARELTLAITQVAQHQRYFPRHVLQQMKKSNTHQFTEYDLQVISLLSQGIRQKDIPSYLQQQQLKPSGLSSLEKRLNQIKEALEFTTNEQLIAFCKDMGLI